eukprot:6195602-Pleurochrysis_carterae.AAC.1
MMTLKNNKVCCRQPCTNPSGQRICPLHQCVPCRCAKPFICLDSTSILLSKVDRMPQTQKEASETLARLWGSMLHEAAVEEDFGNIQRVSMQKLGDNLGHLQVQHGHLELVLVAVHHRGVPPQVVVLVMVGCIRRRAKICEHLALGLSLLLRLKGYSTAEGARRAFRE